MPDVQRSLAMQAPPDAVLALASDIRDLPRQVPTTREAEPQGRERVHVEGEAQGRHCDADGYLRRRDGGLERGADEAPSGDDINEGVREGLEPIRNHAEARGGKEEPSAATRGGWPSFGRAARQARQPDRRPRWATASFLAWP